MQRSAASPPDLPSILLVRTLPAERNRSMDRYADELGQAMRQRADLRFRDTALQPSRWSNAPLIGSLDRRFTRFVRYGRHLRRQQADIYHLMDHTQADLIGSLPAERTVVTCHDLMLLRAERESFGFRGHWAAVRLFKWRVGHLRSVAHVACISQQTQRDLIEFVGVDPERTSVIPNGVDPRFTRLPDEVRGALRAAVVPPGTSVLLHVSTGDPYKNVEGTLRTVAALRAGGEAVVLLRAGRPLSVEQRELAAGLGVDGAVHDLGRVDDQRLVELYNLADVLLFPSHYEGFGWPPLEAMACGTPVVTSEASALLEVTGDAALHASADSPPALAGAVRTILDDTATRDRLAAAGQERAAHYRWSDTADAYAAVYHQLLDRDRRRTGGDYISAG